MKISDLLSQSEVQELCWFGHVEGVEEIEREYGQDEYVKIYFTKNNKTYCLKDCEQTRRGDWYFDCATIVEVEKVEVLSHVWKEVK